MAAPISFGQIAKRTNFVDSLVSHRLRLPTAARLVSCARHGKRALCQASDRHISEALANMSAHSVAHHPSEQP